MSTPLVKNRVSNGKTTKWSLCNSCRAFVCSLNYDCLKSTSAWIVDQCSVEINVSYHIIFEKSVRVIG